MIEECLILKPLHNCPSWNSARTHCNILCSSLNRKGTEQSKEEAAPLGVSSVRIQQKRRLAHQQWLSNQLCCPVLLVDAKEGSNVAIIDISRAFMQADMEDIVHMKLDGKMAELMVRIEPQMNRQYLQNEKGRTVLYVELKKALHGTLKAALVMFWKMLSSQLLQWGFNMNPYNSCVMNKIVDGKKCMILLHVDG